MSFSAPPFPGGFVPNMNPGMPLAPAPPVDMDDEPPNKKNRTEDNLIPENVFLQCHKVSNQMELVQDQIV